MRQGCGIAIITLGAHGCYGASADESRLRKLLGDAYPRHFSNAFASQRVLIPAYACEGSVNSVGAGDSFLAGIVAALCHYSARTCDNTSGRSDQGGSALDLAQLLRIGKFSCHATVLQWQLQNNYNLSERLQAITSIVCGTGAASSCFKVDSAKDGCPPLPQLLERMGQLDLLPVDSARLTTSNTTM